MNNNRKIYYAVNFKLITTYFWFLITLGITSFGVWFAYVLIRDGEWKISLFTIPFVSIFPIILIFSLKSRIILTKDSIVRKTPFNNKELKYNEIKTFKRYDIIGNGSGNVSYLETKGRTLDSNVFNSQKMIFVSDSKNSHPNKFSKSKQFSFHETSDIYIILKERITNTDDS